MDEPRVPDVGVPSERVVTACHECAGLGGREVGLCACLGERLGTVVATVACPVCGATGVVDGVVPPL